MPRKPSRRKSDPQVSFIDFDFGDRTYQIDPSRRKVYRRFVEIETSKAVEIFSLWRSTGAGAHA